MTHDSECDGAVEENVLHDRIGWGKFRGSGHPATNRSNIRRLEGGLIRVACYAVLTSKKLSLELVESLLREIFHEEGHHAISIEVIQKKVAEHFDIRLADMTSKRRPENIAFPRQIAMFFSRQMTESSLNTIGEAFGSRDHGTVSHACRLVRNSKR